MLFRGNSNCVHPRFIMKFGLLKILTQSPGLTMPSDERPGKQCVMLYWNESLHDAKLYSFNLLNWISPSETFQDRVCT